MKKILFFTAILFLLLGSTAMNAQLDYIQKGKVDKLFKNKSVVYFKFPVHSMSEIPQVGKIVTVDKSKGSMVFAHANKPQFSTFIKMNYAYTELPPPGQKKPATTVKKKTTTTTKKTTTTTTTKKAVKK